MASAELTVIIPVYNEVMTVGPLLDAVLAAPYEKQVIVVDDGSTDGTGEALALWRTRSVRPIELVTHPTNRGKGAAIRTALVHARGRVVLIQDADLEYDPSQYPIVVEPILDGRADAVYGSRYLMSDGQLPWTLNRVCVVFLNATVRLLYGYRLTDEATCYKAFRGEILARMDLHCQRFEFCPEVTAKACRMGVRLLEVPIRYKPRSRDEGKKIRWQDGVEAITTLFRWRFAKFEAAPLAFEAPPQNLSKWAPAAVSSIKN